MNSKVIKVKPIGKSNLYLKFNNGESGLFDVSPYWNSSFFKELQDITYFRRVKVWNGTVQWPHEQDFAPETLSIELRKKIVRVK
jgi:Protein of unknown function (DUF2442)